MKNLHTVLMLLVAAVALAASGCDAGPEPTAANDGDRRAAAASLGKADAPGTCKDSCGGKGKGQCWCDDLCANYGDCCADKADQCEEPSACGDVMCALYCEHGFKTDANGCDICACNDAPTPADSCEGNCGSKAPSGCWCDEECAKYGDCCSDKKDACDAPPEPEPCFVGGCSGQLCTDQPGAISTCEFLPHYACYKQEFAACERQDDGTCGWTMNDEMQQCLDGGNTCKPVLCEIACTYGWQQDENGCDICACAPEPCPPVAKPAPEACPGGTWEPNISEGGCVLGFSCKKDCFPTGCGGTMCSDTEIVNIWCPQDDVYACYEQDFATCERQDNGECGWTASAELDQCIEDGGPGCQPVLCKMYCEYGWATDPATGCEICACAEPPVTECPALPCKMDCPGGLVKDDNGCDTCACADPVGCQGFCGEKSDEGCWCDSTCESYGDCCDNKQETCGG